MVWFYNHRDDLYPLIEKQGGEKWHKKRTNDSNEGKKDEVDQVI